MAFLVGEQLYTANLSQAAHAPHKLVLGILLIMKLHVNAPYSRGAKTTEQARQAGLGSSQPSPMTGSRSTTLRLINTCMVSTHTKASPE